MKKYFCLLILFIFTLSCKNKLHFYDVDGPIFDFYKYIDDNILFQYNEPVKNIKFVLNENNKLNEFEANLSFPVANIRVPYDFFKNKNKCLLEITAIDTSGNSSQLIISSPIINNNPVLLQIKEINIKYSEKRKQKIILKTANSGSTTGYKFVLFIHNKKITLPFLYEELKTGDQFEITIDSDKDNYKENYELSFYKKNIELIFKNRLSLIYSLIYILDDKNNILDYFIYYDLKKKELNYYKTNKNFINLKNELLIHNITPEVFDISETTSIKNIVKIGNRFVVNKH